MENWEDILKRQQAERGRDADERKAVLFNRARAEADKNIANYYQPFLRHTRTLEHLQSIRDNVWKAGTLSLTDELRYSPSGARGGIGTTVINYDESFSHLYKVELTEGRYRVGLRISGSSFIHADFTHTLVSGERSLNINTNASDYYKVPQQFEYMFAEYCQNMTRMGYITKNGIVR